MNHKYFTISELCFSQKALEHRIKNVASKEIEDNLDALIVKVLDPTRAAMGRPITVTSGFRCKAVNYIVSNSKTSQHLVGQAADITLGSKELNRKMAKWIVDHLTFDQLIIENGYGLIHVSYKKSGLNRIEIRRQVGNSYPIIKKEDM